MLPTIWFCEYYLNFFNNSLNACFHIIHHLSLWCSCKPFNIMILIFYFAPLILMNKLAIHMTFISYNHMNLHVNSFITNKWFLCKKVCSTYLHSFLISISTPSWKKRVSSSLHFILTNGCLNVATLGVPKKRNHMHMCNFII